MKKTLIVSAFFIAAAFVCVACTDDAKDYTASSEEIQVPDDIEVPDAASTINNILNNEDVVDIPQMDEDALAAMENEAKEALEESKEEIDIYYVFGSYEEFMTDSSEVDINPDDLLPEADDILGALATHNIVPIDCKVIEFSISDLEDGSKAVNLDLTKNFDNYLSTMSEDAKDAIIGSVADTFIKAYEADCIYLFVEGNPVVLSDGSGNPLVWTEVPNNTNNIQK